jgi:hypothetical protein
VHGHGRCHLRRRYLRKRRRRRRATAGLAPLRARVHGGRRRLVQVDTAFPQRAALGGAWCMLHRVEG